MENPIDMADEKNRATKATSGQADSQPLVEVVWIDKLLNVHEKTLVPAGTILLEALKPIGSVQGPCGGIGKCGRCVVEIDDGRLVQACFFRVKENVTVLKWRGL